RPGFPNDPDPPGGWWGRFNPGGRVLLGLRFCVHRPLPYNRPTGRRGSTGFSGGMGVLSMRKLMRGTRYTVIVLAAAGCNYPTNRSLAPFNPRAMSQPEVMAAKTEPLSTQRRLPTTLQSP